MNSLLSLKKEIVANKLDAVLISSASNILYLTNFYFSQHEREAFLLITKTEQYILTDGRYSQAVKNQIKNFKLIEISPRLTFEKVLKDLAKKHKIKKIGIEESNITVKEHKALLSSRPSPKGARRDLLHHSLDSLRVIKDEREISNIQKACELGDKTFKYILNKIKLGVTEKELAFEIEFFIKKQGADISFPPIVAFGKNSAIPHHKPTEDKLKRNSIVLLDFGAKINNYCSDMTRTVFFGSANAEYKKIYQTALTAQQKAIDFLANKDTPSRRSILAKNVDKVARSYITSHGYLTTPHSLGHGIGLEVHEPPRLSPKSKDTLKPGMVFTIEPGIYIPGFGGVRIEDVVVLEKTGLRLLTNSPRDIFELH